MLRGSGSSVGEHDRLRSYGFSRRAVAGSLLGWPLLPATACARTASEPVVPLRSADAFLDGIGVNTHLPYTDGAYGDLGRVARAIEFLGIRHIRDRAPQEGYQGQTSYDQLVEAIPGLRLCLFVSGDIDRQIERLAAFAVAHPGGLSLIEGPNEINNEGARGVARGDHAAAQAYQARLYARVRDTSQLVGVPVLNFTDYPDTSGKADAANVHSYPKRRAPPGGTLRADLARQRGVQPQGPAYLTECGYQTGGTGADDVTEFEQARLTLLLLLEAFALGVRRSYVYELLDERSGDHWGLMRSDGAPKPAAVALRTLLGWLRDPPLTRVDTIITDVQGGGALQLLHRSGVRDLLIWNEQPGVIHLRLSRPAAAELLRPLSPSQAFDSGREHAIKLKGEVALLRLRS